MAQVIVNVQNLHVLITTDAHGWFAQGVELDYFAQGKSLDDVKQRFEAGFAATIHEHLGRSGTILLPSAPKNVRDEMINSADLKAAFSQVSIHNLEPVTIEYLEKAA